jgi:predicted nucleic acid-binding protein
MIFVDSSAWFAVFSLRDVNHSSAMQALRSFREELLTSDYIVDETLTLLRARGENRRAIVFGKRVIEGNWAGVVTITEQDFS